MSRHQAPSDEVNALRLAVMELWDPIGVADIPEAVDEYDSYLPSIRRELHEGFPHTRGSECGTATVSVGGGSLWREVDAATHEAST